MNMLWEGIKKVAALFRHWGDISLPLAAGDPELFHAGAQGASLLEAQLPFGPPATLAGCEGRITSFFIARSQAMGKCCVCPR